jgi:hypothetical protein
MKPVLLKLREISPLSKYWSVTANVIGGGGGDFFAKFCIFLLSSVANFLDKNLEVTFRHPEHIPEPSCTLNSRRRLTTTEQAPGPKTFRIFWPFISPRHKYISHTYASCNFTSLRGFIDWTCQAGVDTQYCMQSVADCLPTLSAVTVRSCGLDQSSQG